ncbi:MAG TPA: zinc-binding dehydrogenase [Gaiella sp.]|nr:zinc-binding dehydrogenase [Gaiella sp.]
MKALVLDEDRRLELRDVSEPVAGTGQTVVEVRAAGVNYADVLIREGRYPQPPPLPYVPGSEVAGTTADGRRVVGFVRVEGGGYAERVAVEDDWLFDLPARASFEQGAAFVLAYLTAWIPLTRQVVLRPGARVLVTAAAGGVGSAGVQLAASLGAHVVGAVGSPEKRDHVLGLGAAEAILYDEVGGLEPFDVILDQVGGEVFAAGLERLRPLGTIVAVGFAGGAWPTVDPARLVGRNTSVAGFYLGRLMRFEPELVRAAVGQLLEQWAAGSISPSVGASFPLAEGDEALRMVAERRSTGKVVLLP